jgi:hypothetical protein
VLGWADKYICIYDFMNEYCKKFGWQRWKSLVWKPDHTVNVDFLRIEYMVLAKYQHMSILEFILIIKQHILILCKKSNPCYQVGFCTEFHIHQGNMSSLVGKVVSNKCCLCVNPLPPPPRSNTHCIVMRAQKIFSPKISKCWVNYQY